LRFDSGELRKSRRLTDSFEKTNKTENNFYGRNVKTNNQSKTDGSVKNFFAGYKGGEEMPLAGYAALLGIYNAAFLALLLAARNSDDGLPERISFPDLLLLGVATHKLSRVIAKDRVTSPLRAPFTEYVEGGGRERNKRKSARARNAASGRRFTYLSVVRESVGCRRFSFRFGFQTAGNQNRRRSFRRRYRCGLSASRRRRGKGKR
jgi:hypothetical protein